MGFENFYPTEEQLKLFPPAKPHQKFSLQEELFITDNYSKYGRVFCSLVLKRSIFSIEHKAQSLGVRRETEVFPPEHSKCCGCRKIKHYKEFPTSPVKLKNGVKAYCKICHNIRNKEKWTDQKNDPQQVRRLIIKNLLRCAKRRAKVRNLPFELTYDFIDLNLREKCPVLNIKFNIGGGRIDPALPSLDRVNPKIGYIPSNVRVISLRANSLKNNASISELKGIINYIKNEKM